MQLVFIEVTEVPVICQRSLAVVLTLTPSLCSPGESQLEFAQLVGDPGKVQGTLPPCPPTSAGLVFASVRSLNESCTGSPPITSKVMFMNTV